MRFVKALQTCEEVVDGREVNKRVSSWQLQSGAVDLRVGRDEVLYAFRDDNESNVTLVHSMRKLQRLFSLQELCLGEVELGDNVLNAVRDLLIVAVTAHAAAVGPGVGGNAV